MTSLWTLDAGFDIGYKCDMFVYPRYIRLKIIVSEWNEYVISNYMIKLI